MGPGKFKTSRAGQQAGNFAGADSIILVKSVGQKPVSNLETQQKLMLQSSYDFFFLRKPQFYF